MLLYHPLLMSLNAVLKKQVWLLALVTEFGHVICVEYDVHAHHLCKTLLNITSEYRYSEISL